GAALQPTRCRGRTFRLLRCASCGSYRIDPPPIACDEESSAFYSAYYAGRGRDEAGADTRAVPPERSSRFWRVAKQLPWLEWPAGRVIDFGSGDGNLCGELARAGWRNVVGIEVSRARAARARARYPGITFFDR